jgi:N-acylneuraminate cytidylyltransferase
MTPRVVGFIFARGGSKGVPRKNIRPLADKPLIAYAIEAALASEFIDTVIVSTDDLEIASVAKKCGAEVPFMRPPELARDDSPEWLSWQHAIREVAKDGSAPAMDVFVSIPTTAPLRSVEDIDACIRKLLTTDADLVLTVRPADKSPYFNMVTLADNADARLAIVPEKPIYRRQDAPVVYTITTAAYAARPEFILNHSAIFQGKVKAVVVPPERAIDIDTQLDFDFAEFLLKRSL